MTDGEKLDKLIEDVARVRERSHNIANHIQRIEATISKTFVTKDEFKPVKAVVYGLSGIILASSFAALMNIIK